MNNKKKKNNFYVHPSFKGLSAFSKLYLEHPATP